MILLVIAYTIGALLLEIKCESHDCWLCHYHINAFGMIVSADLVSSWNGQSRGITTVLAQYTNHKKQTVTKDTCQL